MTAESLLHILLVDDNPADSRWFHEELRESGPRWCHLEHVENLGDALARLAQGGIDAILLDLSLPDAKGIDTVQRVRAVAPQMPVVVLTGFNDEQAALRAVQEGAQDYLVKDQVNGALLARAVRYAVERKRAEEAQRREVAAAQAAQLREQFVAVLGHDLRNPLSSIAMSAGLLLKGADLSERQSKSVARIARSADRMNRMIGDLLDFTRTRLGGGYTLSRRSGSLSDVCRQVVEELETVHAQRIVKLNAEGRVVGHWDMDRMAQLTSNLISNGLQYSPADAPVLVTVKEAGEQALLEVNNQGEPIPPHLLPKLFEPFYRVQSDTAGSSGKGLGLGLYIAQQIVLAHGGTIDVSSSKEQGTTISVSLPR